MMGSNDFGQLGVGFADFPHSFLMPTNNQDFQMTFNKETEMNKTPSDLKQETMVFQSSGVNAPRLVEALKNIHLIKIGCGANYTMALSSSSKSKSAQ